MINVMKLCFWLSVHFSVVNIADASSAGHDFYFPGVINTVYSQLGDINIGASVLVTKESDTYPSGACSREINRPQYILETTEAIAFATDLINNNPNILPNVTFGFVIRGSCSSVGVTTATSLSFLPRNPGTGNVSALCSSASSSSTIFSSDLGEDYSGPRVGCHQHDVIGTLAPGWSSLTVPVSALQAVAHLPMVGSVETSDELSDKSKHPYFFRVVPPDVYRVLAMLNFVSSNTWSYISVLYVDGTYGQNAFDNINRMAERYGICVATSHRLFIYTDYKAVVSDLLEHSRARAVLLFLYANEFKVLLEAVVDQNATGHFIWVGSGSLVMYGGHQYKGITTDPGLGAFIFEVNSQYEPSFYTYLENQSVISSRNPWMKTVLEYLFDCSFDIGNCENNTNPLDSPKYQPLKSTALKIDAVLTFAQAAHDLLANRCPNAREKMARACITGELLREYLKNVSFDGILGRVEFNENQELTSNYIISQFQFLSQQLSNSNNESSSQTRLLPVQIGTYDISRDTTEIYSKAISWSHLNTLDRIYPWRNAKDSLPIEVPESVCSRPCLKAEYKIEKELPCCWECRRCRDNERLVNGNTNCEACPPLTWPNHMTDFTTCIEILPTFSTFGGTISVVLTSLTVFAMIVYSFTCIGYISYRNRRVIKASSKELSVIQLVAVLAGYVNILLFQMKPTNVLCNAIYFLFCLSFVLLYAPLLVKTIRILRIFQSGKSNNRELRFISPESQLFISGCLVAVQIVLCVATFILFSPGARRTQPIWSEKLVELSCDLTLPGLTSFLGYNIVLVSLCAVFAVKVRKLPDNFNESQFIAMCVATTLLIWLAFVPTYFTAGREYVRIFLLSIALLLNHSVALIFLFIPKIYAAAFISQESGKLSDGKS